MMYMTNKRCSLYTGINVIVHPGCIFHGIERGREREAATREGGGGGGHILEEGAIVALLNYFLSRVSSEHPPLLLEKTTM